jgi:hypothetical protein
MSKRKADHVKILTDSVAVGAGMVIAGQRYLVTDMQYTVTLADGSVLLSLGLKPWANVDPTLYRLKPRRRRKPCTWAL